MWLILQNVIAFLPYVTFSHNVRTVRVRYSGRERTVAPCLLQLQNRRTHFGNEQLLFNQLDGAKWRPKLQPWRDLQFNRGDTKCHAQVPETCSE